MSVVNQHDGPIPFGPSMGSGRVPTSRQVGGDHYAGMAIQPTEFIVKNKLSWNEGNAVKYICRHKNKGGIKDILKAMHYLELELLYTYHISYNEALKEYE